MRSRSVRPVEVGVEPERAERTVERLTSTGEEEATDAAAYAALAAGSKRMGSRPNFPLSWRTLVTSKRDVEHGKNVGTRGNGKGKDNENKTHPDNQGGSCDAVELRDGIHRLARLRLLSE